MLKKDEYLRTVRRPYPPFWNSVMLQGSSIEEYYTDLLDNQRFAILQLVKSDEVWYYAADELKVGSEYVMAAWSSTEKIKQVVSMLEERERKLIAAVTSKLEDFIGIFEMYMPALILIFMADKPVADKLKNYLTKAVGDKETVELMNQLNIPLRDNYYKQEELELVTTKNLAAHVKKYEFLNARYGDDSAYTIQEAQAKLAELDVENYVQERGVEKKKVRSAIERAKKALGNNAYLVDMMQFIIYYRTQRTDVINRVIYEYIPNLKNLARERGITYQELLHATYSEVRTQLPPVKLLRQRIKKHAFLMEDGNIRVAIGDEVDEIAQFFKEDLRNTNAIHGSIACQGRVTGVARLVFSKADLDAVSEGNILVTSMTTPNMISAMKRAAAFVTDEGGITSHAAIISRELNKPCIIGTKHATQVLKNGDEVEVDADKGMVKKL
jgi:phosphoenolpyruvate synthase/pyruvate phosphate dikinase